jgi:hypothetical protein
VKDEPSDLPLSVSDKPDLRYNTSGKKLCLTFGEKLDWLGSKAFLGVQLLEKTIAVAENMSELARRVSELVIADVLVKILRLKRHGLARPCLFIRPLCAIIS